MTKEFVTRVLFMFLFLRSTKSSDCKTIAPYVYCSGLLRGCNFVHGVVDGAKLLHPTIISQNGNR